MRIIQVLSLVCLLLASCKTTNQPVTTAADQPPGSTKAENRDGSSIEKAVIATSISMEYEWIRAHYPGSKVTRQALINKDGKRYDKLTTTLADGTVRDFYFDINRFFGKF